MLQYPPYGPNTYDPGDYPMKPLFMSAGMSSGLQQSGVGASASTAMPPPSTLPMSRGPLTTMPLQRAGTITVPPQLRPGVITVPPLRVTPVPLEGGTLPLSSAGRLPAAQRQSAATRQALYSRGPASRSSQAQTQASSSSTKVEDIDVEGGEEGQDKAKVKGKGARKIVRAKRYNRKKREEWPPPGWIPIWEEERPRMWGAHEIPDEVPTGEVYDHLKKRFELKSAGICAWQGCKPADPDNPEYKMLKRHVETVHLGLKLVCQLCGVRKRADNRRKATHKRGCPEREREEAAEAEMAAAAAAAAGKSVTKVTLMLAPGGKKVDEAGEVGEEDELAEDDPVGEEGEGDEGEEGEEEEDELEEEVDELQDDQEEENEYESEDD